METEDFVASQELPEYGGALVLRGALSEGHAQGVPPGRRAGFERGHSLEVGYASQGVNRGESHPINGGGRSDGAVAPGCLMHSGAGGDGGGQTGRKS